MRPVALVLLAAATVIVAAPIRPAIAAGEAKVVVELFTSQGCSSCPPADAYLGELAAREDLVALAFHVDYWNYIGWVDPFASKAWTQRQRDYARVLGQRFVYTPEIVVDGQAHDNGSDRAAVERMIRTAAARPIDRPSLVIERHGERKARLRIGAAAAAAPPPPNRPAVIWLARFDRERTTRVGRGENGGRTLTNYRVVREFREIGQWDGRPVEIALDLPPASPEGGHAVVLQNRSDGAGGVGPILGAALIH
jgi:hypothetical protein